MKKTISILLTGCALQAAAQFDFGVKMGINTSRLLMDDIQNPNQIVQSLQSGDGRFGFQGGLFSAINFLTYQVRIEGYYSSVNVEYKGTKNNQPFTENVTLNRFDFPILFGLKFGPVRANFGPVMSYNISSTNDVLENGLKNGTLGGQIGLGIDFLKFFMETRYEFGLSRFSDQVTIDGQSIPLDSRVSLISLAVGYKLF